MTWTRTATLLLLGSALAIGPYMTSAPADDKPAAGGKKDLFGDSLPDGALARMGTLRWRQNSAVSFVGFTSQGKQLLTGGTDGAFHVWDMKTGKAIRHFGSGAPAQGGSGIMLNNVGAVMSINRGGGAVALSPDGAILAAPARGNQIALWDVATGKELRAISTVAGSSAFSPDGKLLATRGNDTVIRLWEVASGKAVRQLGNPPGAGRNQVIFFGGLGVGNPLAFSPDGKTIGFAGSELENMQRIVSLVRLYDVESGKELRQIKSPDNGFANGSLAFAPDGKSVGWTLNNGTVRFFDTQSGKEARTLGTPQPGMLITTLLVSPTGKLLAVRASNSIGLQLWDFESGKEVRRLGEPPAKAAVGLGRVRVGGAALQGAAFSPDGSVVAEGSGNTVRLWTVADGKEVLPATGHRSGISPMGLSRDGKVLTTHGQDDTLRQWDVATGKELRHIQLPAGASSVALSADGAVAAYMVLGQVKILDIAGNKELRSLTAMVAQPAGGRAAAGVSGLALSSDGKLVALRGFDQVIRIVEVATGKEQRALSEQQAAPAQGNPAATRVFVGGNARGPMVFSPDDAALVTTTGTAAVAANPGGGFAPAAAANGTSLRIWGLEGGRRPRRSDTQQRNVTTMAFSPDRRLVVTVNSDNTISGWEVLTGKECFQFKLPQAAKPAPPQPGTQAVIGGVAWYGAAGTAGTANLAISADGRTLAAGSGDSVRLWDLRTLTELGNFKGHLGSVQAVLFGPESRYLISGSADTTALVWDLSGKVRKAGPGQDLKAEQIEELWKDLAGEPAKAFLAAGKLASAAGQAVKVCRERLTPAAGVDSKRIEQYIADLESEKFTTRRKAAEELEKLGELAEPALKKSLEKKSSLETRKRVERLLDQIANDQVPSPDVQRSLRSLAVLEQIGTAEARDAIASLTSGAPGAKLTREAQETLKRLKK